MSTDKVKTELRHDGQVLSIKLNAPKGNVLDSEMMTGIEAALEKHSGDAALKAIIFEGEGKHFSFGASVEEHVKEKAGAMLAQFHRMFRNLAALGVPTFAVVRGQCLGGGMELAAYCTWIFASPDAQFGQPEIKLAVLAPVASVLFPWRLGGGKAMDLCVSGRSITAEDAKRIGLVEEVVDDPSAACAAFIEKNILDKSASSLRFAERAVRYGLTELLESSLEKVEKLYLQELMETHDANEGIAAFLERRKPQFRGVAR